VNDNLNALTPNKVVDARGMACPGPLLEAKKSIGRVSLGQIVERPLCTWLSSRPVGGGGWQFE
jgi:hypothetical protein